MDRLDELTLSALLHGANWAGKHARGSKRPEKLRALLARLAGRYALLAAFYTQDQPSFGICWGAPGIALHGCKAKLSS